MSQSVRSDTETGEADGDALMAELAPPPRRLARRIRSSLPTAIVIGIIILIWEFFNTVTGEPDYVLPPLHDIIFTGVDRAVDKFLPATWITLQEIVLGFLWGSTIGFLLGAAIFHFKTVRQAILPLVIGTQAIPVIAIAPILIIWFGFGMAPKIIVAAIIVFFPVAINTIAGFSSVDREMISLMDSMGASKWHVFSKVRFPGALPFIFAGLKNAAAIAAIGAIVGEWVGAHEGLGPVMIGANAAFKTDVVFAAIFYLAFIAVSLFVLVTLAERWLIPWNFVGRQRQE